MAKTKAMKQLQALAVIDPMVENVQGPMRFHEASHSRSRSNGGKLYKGGNLQGKRVIPIVGKCVGPDEAPRRSQIIF